MVNELLNRYIDQNEMLCVQRTQSSLDCIESTWMWTHEEPLDMNEVHLFLCDEHSGKLSDEQKEFVRACRNWVQEQLQSQVFIRLLQDEDLRKNVVDFCKEYKSADELPMVLNVREMAAVLGIGLAHAYEVVRKEDFPSITLGERIVIPRDRFLQWMESEVDKKLKK